MPREVAFTCHTCDRKYNGARCLHCHPSRGRRRGQGGGGFGGGRRGARSRIESVLASDQLVGHSIFDGFEQQVMPLTGTARSEDAIASEKMPAEK